MVCAMYRAQYIAVWYGMEWYGMVWYDILEIVECEKSDVLKKKAAPKLFLDLGIGVDAEMGSSKSLTLEDIYQ